MKLKGNTGYLAALTLLLSLGFLVLWEFWLETIILVDYLEIEIHKNDLDRWAFIVSCLSIVCLSLVLPFQSMKSAVDEMKSMETALHGEQTLSKVFFTVDNSIILVIDTANSIMQINDKAASLLGYKEEELLGHDWISLLVPDKSRDAVKNQYKQFINDKSQNLLRFSAPVKTKGGTEKMIDWQCSPLKDERDKVYGTINSGQDISESMRLRKELSHIKGKFEPQIKKLTADLNFNKKKYHSEAIKSANARARFKFWFDLENTLISLTPQELNTPEEVNTRIKKALQLFGEMTNVDQGYIFNFTQDETHMVNTHLWVSGEPLLEPDPDDEISLENFPWFKKQMQKKEVIHLPKITDMPEEASSEMEVYVSQGIKSLINAPIIQNDSVVGYIGFESNQKERTWDQDEINVVQVMGRLISRLMHASASTEPQIAAETGISMEPQLELEVPELSLEGPKPSQKPTQETAPSLKKELKAAKAAFEKELQEKVNEMEQTHSKLLAELKERKQVEADLRTNRDAIERHLGEKSLQLEKLLAEAGAGAKEKSSKESKAGVPGTPGKIDPDEIQKENEVMRNALQKKEAELATLRSQLKSQAGDLTASEIEDYQEKISDKDLEISTLRKSFEKEQSARAKLKKQLSLLQESISDQGGETESLQAANQVLEGELEELQTLQGEFNASANQLEDTQRELESLEIANEQLMTDIEERDYHIEEAKEKAKRYEQMDLPIFTLNQEGIILTWNKAAASLTSYISELALDQTLTFMFAEKDEFNYESELLAPLRENSKHRIEVPIKKANGTVFNGLISLVSFKDRNGIISTLGYFINLSDAENEDEIKSIKKQFTTLLGHSGLILVHLTPDYRISEMNEKAETTFPWELDSVLEKNFFEVVLAGDNWEETFADIQGRLDTEDSVNLETQFTFNDQTKHTFLWNLIKETHPKDKTDQGFLAIAQDITGLQTAQNQLHDNDFLLNIIVDKATDGLITIDENGIIHSFNEGAENLFGFASHEIIGKNVSELMPAPYNKEHDNYIRKYMDTGESSFVGGAPREFIGKNKSGSTFPIEITLREFYKGYQRLFVAIARDIRKRKEAEIQLVESQEKYNRFMDAESNAVLILDGNTKRIMECNPAAPRLYGYEPQEFLNMNLKDLIADAEPSNSNLSPASGLGSIQKATQVYQKRKDGTLFPANVTTSSFRLRDIDYELKIISSTSEHMEMEEQLKETREEFERYLETQGSHVDQITQEKEEQRIALREEKLNTVKQITASMVDLVNNPIQGIEKILEQVKEKAKMEDVHKGLVTVAMNECRRVGELIGKLKNYQPPAPEDLEPLDVHQVLDEILQSNMDTLNHRTITLEKEYAAGIPLIDGVTQQIRQAIHNIVKNAEESFTHDEGKITISTEQDGSHVIIHIKDNGCGIPEKDLDRIFDPFYTTKSALHRPGLGLLASLGIIKNHQGEIDVHSRPGEGTTFTVTLPFKQAKNPNNGQF